jgi:magnesium transporter
LLIELVGVRPNDLAILSQRFAIDLEDLQDVQDLDERPRLQIEDKYTMIVLRVPVNLSIKDRQNSTIPVAVFTNGRDIIIIQNEEVPLRKPKLRQKIYLSTTAADIIYTWW